MMKAEKERALSLLTELQTAERPRDYEEMDRLSERYLQALDEIFVDGLLVVTEIKSLVRLINHAHAEGGAAFTDIGRIIRWQAMNLQEMVEKSVVLSVPVGTGRRTVRVFAPCCLEPPTGEAQRRGRFSAECRQAIEEERRVPAYRMPAEEEGLYRILPA